MTQEQAIRIEISNDGINFQELTTLVNGYKNNNNILNPEIKYYRVKAIGDGVNTIDSEYSNIVSISKGFSYEYQRVLNYAISLDIVTPSISQNIINDIMVLNLVNQGIWNELDVFYYFKQEDGLYDFLTLNWKDPEKYRLINSGSNNVDFVANNGFKVLGGNNQYFDTQFNPSLHAIKFLKSSSSMIFSLFDVATTDFALNRVVGGYSDALNQINIINSTSGSLLARVYDSSAAGNTYTFPQSEINKHYQISDLSTAKKIFTNGSVKKEVSTTQPSPSINATIDIFGVNLNGTHSPSENAIGIKYIMWGSALMYEDSTLYNILNNTYFSENKLSNSVLGFNTSSSALPTLLFPQVVRSDKFPTLSTTKKYIVLYSTDHALNNSSPIPANGAICWGEADSPLLEGFIERGVIIAGYQSETPHLELCPNDPNGEIIHLYYHPGVNHPDCGGIQQSRLLTRTGGLLHDSAGWTDRGKILGLMTTPFIEQHTGYLQTYKQNDNSFIGVHVTKGWFANTASDVPKIGISHSSDGTTWTRLTSEIDVTSYMPFFRQFHMSPSLYFERNGIQYCVARNATYDFDNKNTKISIVRCDGNYHPVAFVGEISSNISGNKNTNAGYYIEEDILYVYFIVNKIEMRVASWDLKNLD